MEINYKQLTFAREYRGFTQTELAKHISGLSQSKLSKFEKGIGFLSDELFNKIIYFLGFPKSFFYKRIYNFVENPHYRIRSTIRKKTAIQIDSAIKIIGYIVDQMSESIEWPDFNLDPLDIEDGFSVRNIAEHTRKSLCLKPDDPVRKINNLLEKHGIIIIEIDIAEKFDGASINTDGGTPVIIINEKFSNDRKRFTLAHELGHLLMHILGGFPIPDYRDKEQEANAFASNFLMPEDSIKNSLYGLKLSALASLKNYWLTSMASIINRAFEIKCIDVSRYKYLNIEMSKLGYKKREAVNVYIDSPTLFFMGYKMHKNELEYSDAELSKAFCLPDDIIKTFCVNGYINNKFKLSI